MPKIANIFISSYYTLNTYFDRFLCQYELFHDFREKKQRLGSRLTPQVSEAVNRIFFSKNPKNAENHQYLY